MTGGADRSSSSRRAFFVGRIRIVCISLPKSTSSCAVRLRRDLRRCSSARPMTTYERPTVLLVEDDNATREMFDYALRMAGFSVTAVRDGFAALRSIEQGCPDIVVLDLDLPHVSGLDVHQELMSHAERSEEHTSELQSLRHLVCRLLLEKKKDTHTC